MGDSYPLPNMSEILDQLVGAQYFFVFDLASGFHKIKMTRQDSHKLPFLHSTAIMNSTSMPFVLKNALASFQRLMDFVLTGLSRTYNR